MRKKSFGGDEEYIVGASEANVIFFYVVPAYVLSELFVIARQTGFMVQIEGSRNNSPLVSSILKLQRHLS